MEHFEFNNTYDRIICKECGSDDIYIRAGMFCNSYTCKNCGIREHE